MTTVRNVAAVQSLSHATTGEYIYSTSMEDSAGWISLFLLLYLEPLFKKGSLTDLSASDLGGISHVDRSSTLYDKFTVAWEEEKLRKDANVDKMSLWHVLWKTCGYWRLFLGILLFAGGAGLQYGPILILNYLVRYFQGSIALSSAAIWIMVVLLFVCTMLSSILTANSNAMMAHLGVEFRNVLIDAIYRYLILTC